jgi:cytochrome c-type biogenesis protein
LEEINILLAFGAGFLSFLSPCCLPLYPAFLSYVTGVSVSELKEEKGMFQKRSILHTLFFLIGFSLIFVVLGMSSSIIGEWFIQYNDLIQQLGAILIIIFGLFVVGVLKPTLLMKEYKLNFKNRPSGYLGSILIGMGFAAGWTPCTGPILASVLAMSVSNPDLGLIYMIVYSLGFAVPFFVLSFFLGKLSWIKKHNRKAIKIGGILMIIMGVFLYFDWMTKLTSFLINRVFNGFTGF